MNKRFIFFLFLLFSSFNVRAQDVPIGYWESLLPYNSALGIATDGRTIFTICAEGFYTLDVASGQMESYSKVNGMSDIGMESIGYDARTSTVVLGYTDGNIDLFKNNTFYNIPDLKMKAFPVAKSVYQVFTENGFAYLGTSLGIVEIDLTQQMITNLYQITVGTTILSVKSISILGNYFYAATKYGVFKANKNAQLQNPGAWQILESADSITGIVAVDTSIFFMNKTKIFTLIDDTLQQIYTSPNNLQHIDPGYGSLIVGDGGLYGSIIKRMDLHFNLQDSFNCGIITPSAQALQFPDNSIWVACPTGGLKKRTYLSDAGFVDPPGPTSPYSFDIAIQNRNLWIAHGGYDEKFFAYGSYNGLSNYYNGTWTLYKQNNYAPFNSFRDVSTVLIDEKTGILYAGSYQDGLFTLHPNGAFSIVDQNFPGSIAYPGEHQIISLALDKSDNLWLSFMFTDTQLCVKTADSNWYCFTVPGAPDGGELTTDDLGQVWFASFGGAGVFVFNTNNTISDPSDDTSYHLVEGVGSGNLPSNTTYCVAKDKNNKIWIGTDNGIGVVTNCSAPFTHNPPCDAEWPVATYNNSSGYLLAGYIVSSIAVDGANQKWVGTDDGVWLVSPDGTQIINAFNTDNSPLPSNNIMKIAIDQSTGDVYIGTDAGLVSFRGTATQAESSNQGVLAFPNPVPSGYSGSVAIKGLTDNADVRITDITGHLVFRTSAVGGQAVWNGKDYLGRKPQSGVYLFFVTDPGGKNTYAGKIVFLQ